MRSLKDIPILFLPGMMCDDRVFEPQIQYLKKHFPDQPWSCCDFSQGESIEEMAEGGFEKATSLGWEEFMVYGLSMGGIVAMEMMGWPEVVGAVLLDTNHLNDTPEKKAMREKQIHRLHQGWFKEIIKEMKPFYLSQHRGEKAKKLWKLFYEMANALGEEVFMRQTLALMKRRSYEEILKNYGSHCLILCGEEDILCPPEKHRVIAGLLKNSEFHIIPQAGHIVNLEKPQEVNTLWGNWLMSHMEF